MLFSKNRVAAISWKIGVKIASFAYFFAAAAFIDHTKKHMHCPSFLIDNWSSFTLLFSTGLFIFCETIFILTKEREAETMNKNSGWSASLKLLETKP